MSEAGTTPTTMEKFLSERLGHGTFGIVYKAFYKNQWVAVRKLQESADLTFLQMKQLASLVCISHKNVIQIYDIMFEESNAYVIMEYAENGSLYDFLFGGISPPKYSWQVAVNWGVQIAEGIAYLHAMSPNPIIHCDIRPQKIYILNGGRTLKIAGLDSLTKRDFFLNSTLSHLAPEIIDDEEHTEKIDVYSWGITFWELLTLRDSNEFNDIALPLNCLLNGSPDAVKDLICNCTMRSPTERSRIGDAVTILKELLSNSSSDFGSLSTLEQVDFKDIYLGKRLGYGSTGITYKAFWRDRTIAVRQIYYTIDPKCVKNKLTELSALHHINVTSLFGISVHDGTINLLLEYAENGSLHQFLHNQKYSNKLGFDWGLQMAKGLEYLHSIPLTHSNITPRNILLSRGGKLLKLSLPLPSKKPDSVYRAPEVLKEKVSTVESDIYSWGLIMWQILTRAEPPKGHKVLSVDKTDSFQYLIRKCSKTDPRKRPALKTIIEQLMIHLQSMNGEIESVSLLCEELSSGSYGTVSECVWQNELIIVKVIHKETIAIQEKFEHLYQCNHVNILEIYGYSLHKDVIYLRMEHAANGSLHDFLHGEWQAEYSLELTTHWGLQLAEGIAYLHSISMVHGSINPKNLFLSASCRLLKICNFASTTRAEDPAKWYKAPEVISSGLFTSRCDVYSWAITMYEMLKREQPDEEPPLGQFANIILTDEGPTMDDTTRMSSCPEKLLSLMHKCWAAPHPSGRPSINEVVTEMKELLHNTKGEIQVLPNSEFEECQCDCIKCNIM